MLPVCEQRERANTSPPVVRKIPGMNLNISCPNYRFYVLDLITMIVDFILSEFNHPVPTGALAVPLANSVYLEIVVLNAMMTTDVYTSAPKGEYECC
jgi:hypothetical protein